MIQSAQEQAVPKGVFPHNAVADLKTARRRRAAVPNRIDRVAPHSMEAEQGVLGCILLDPVATLPVVAGEIGGVEAFYDLRHQIIYREALAIWDDRKPVELILLQQRLKDRGLLDQTGGIAYLNAIQDAVPSAANLSYYLDYVKEKHLLRRLVEFGTSLVSRVYDYDGEVDKLVDEVERDVMKIAAGAVQQEDKPIRVLVHDAIGEIETMFESQGRITGLSTGFADLDMETDGMQNGDMIVLSGFPSTGKTSLAMNIVEHVVLDLKLPVAVFSHEMTPTALVRRILSSRARLNLRDVRQGIMHEADFPRLTSAAGQLTNSNLHVIKSSGYRLGQIRAKARRLHQQHGIKLFVVDYLQKVGADGRIDKRSDAVAQVSGGLKDLAMELNVPGLVLSQLNNEGGLFMSSETGMDADVIWKLRVDKSSPEWNDAGGVPVELDIEKQRNGATRSIPLTFLRSITRYESAAKVSDGEVQQ